ncbi:MAG: hypothetical protein JNJ75_14845 [Cyclobacteriaceae bacterium]|nr:hypothetical protein [Cyclobacteriaceae bacterium]
MSKSKDEASDGSWKEYLLKSGLPLEYEILKFLSKKGCVVSHEFPYLRNNDQQTETEFSYDIDASYAKLPAWTDLMIECKYRHDSTKWIFLPDSYGGVDEIYHTSFMHPLDHFNQHNKFVLPDFPWEFAPLCSKGVEVTGKEFNPKSITQAELQLAYGMVHRVVDAFDNQTDEAMAATFADTLWFHVPVIVTTAQLYRLNPGITISSIRSTNGIESIASNVDAVIIKSQPGLQLKDYNMTHFANFIDGRSEKLEALLGANKDLSMVMSGIASSECPAAMVVIHHDDENKAFNRLFDYIDKVMKPGPEIFAEINKRRMALNEKMQALSRKRRNQSSGE